MAMSHEEFESKRQEYIRLGKELSESICCQWKFKTEFNDGAFVRIGWTAREGVGIFMSGDIDELSVDDFESIARIQRQFEGWIAGENELPQPSRLEEINA